LVAIEALRTLPVERAVFGHAKVIGVLAARAGHRRWRAQRLAAPP
jgi:hypothetical protein